MIREKPIKNEIIRMNYQLKKILKPQVITRALLSSQNIRYLTYTTFDFKSWPCDNCKTKRRKLGQFDL